MSEQKLTVYQKLQKVLATGSVQSLSTSSNSYNIHQQHQPNDIVDIARSPQEKDFKILQAKQQKLMARQWYRAQQDINNQSLAGLNVVRLMYKDVDLMDTMPEIATAMDIVSEEACLSFDTEIKLLDGTIKTIEDIYKDGLKNFWVYSVDENGKPKPSLVQSAIYKGEKEVYEIVLDDLTTIKCTPNHKWLLSSNEWVETSDLKVGDSLMSIYNKLDYKGYEKIKSTIEDKFTHTHIIVAENIHYDTKLSLINNNINKQKIVIHHSSFNKLNNDPNYLVYMYWNEHQKLHCDLNKKRWENEDFSNKMRAIFSETVQRTWKNKGDIIKSKLKEVWVKRKENLSKEEIKKIYGRCKENNGMFGVHRYGKTNPHFDKSKNQLTDVSENEIIETIINNRERNVSKVIQEKFNLSPHSVRTLKTKLCKKYNITEIQQLKYIFLFPKLKKYCQNNPNVKNVDVYKHFNITEIQLKYFMNFFGYKTFGDFKQQLFNHKVISIKKLNRKIKVYDLKNSSCNKAFGVKCNNGLIISHNCYIGESGSLINISSGSERVKGILQDLFVNRLSVNTTLPMLTRSMIKYGNAFWLLHTDAQLGVLGWKELPVYEIERYENGMNCPYTNGYTISGNRNVDDHKDETRFVWLGQQQATEYRNWQIAHFRLLYDSSMLPYGVSFLHKARRHYRMLSMMEDMMFIYRLDRSVERRVFKINVGAIDEADVPAYVQEIANNFKRTPIIDPMTGQIDMRKNIMPVWKKTPIPLLDGRTITIEDLAREYENGKTNYVYSIQDDTLKVVPGKVVWCGKNYTANNMVKITLDDDSFMVMAPEHEVVMRDGSKKRADKLNVGESVMPFYKTSPKRMEHYEKISESKKNHKIKKIEIIGGDDVYCMTVVGLNGEEDRHNFALRTFNQDESWNENGCFVSNCQTNDYFIPVREDGAASPIENLAAGQNLTAMDDIKYVQNKIVTALRVPKSFLNFEETTGDGKNLSLLDVRFMRTVNRIQQALLLELNKIATIHLLMLGFTDDLTNFTLEMANPSSQAEMLELENLAKKVTTAKDAVSDPGGGMPLASMTWAWRHIFKWSDKEIQQNLEEIRLETALAAELQKTMQIIKKTHLFDPVDNIYGEPGADYSDNGNQMDDEDGGMGGGSGMGGGMPMGGDMDFGDDMDGVEMGAEGDMGMDAAVGEDAAINGQEPPMGDAEGGGAPNLGEMVTNSLKKKTLNEIIKRKEHLQSQRKKNQESVFERYMRTITKGSKDKKPQPRQIYDKAFFMNEELNDMVSKLIKIKPTSLND